MDKKIQNEYFEYNGQRYYAGTKFKMVTQHRGYVEATVIATFKGCYNGNENILCVDYEVPSTKYRKSVQGIHIKRSEIDDYIIEIVFENHCPELEPKKKYVKDFDIPELVVGWPIYIFCMIGGIIFNGYFNGGWLLITIVFFAWRHHLKEKEYYYE